MSAIKISIVIPNYNHAHYLPTAIDHAIHQISPAHEILIIDDGSTDNSIVVIQQYIYKYPQIKLIQNAKNMGVNYTINRGLREATGTHVTFAAADDFIEPNFLQTAMPLLEANPNVGLVSGSCWITYENKMHQRFAARMPYPMRKSGYIPPELARKLINSLDSWFAGNTVILNRLYALEESGYRQELESFTDNFLCRVLASKYGCCFTPAKLATWRICEGGFASSFNINIDRQQKVMQALEQLMSSTYADIFTKDTIYKVKQRFSFNLARTVLNSNNGKVSPELIIFLNKTLSTATTRFIARQILRISSNIPKYNNKIGQLALFLLLRPFDIWQQLQIAMAYDRSC